MSSSVLSGLRFGACAVSRRAARTSTNSSSFFFFSSSRKLTMISAPLKATSSPSSLAMTSSSMKTSSAKLFTVVSRGLALGNGKNINKPIQHDDGCPDFVRELALNVFNSLDTNHDGALTPEDLALQLAANNFDATMIDKVMVATDSNKDGLISFEEFYTGMRYLWAPDKKVSSLVAMQEQSCYLHQNHNVFGVKKNGKYEWMTYVEFGEQVDLSRALLHSLNVSAGGTVAIIANNSPYWAVTAYSTFGLGAKFVPMYEAQLPSDWKYILEDSGASVVFVSSEKIKAIVEPWVGNLGNLKHIICFDTVEQSASFPLLLKQAKELPPIESLKCAETDIASLIYTSGTTGKPKGVLLSHGNILSNVFALEPIFPLTHSDVSVSFLPWAHCFGQTCELHAMVRAGAAVAIAESIPQLAANLVEVRPTMLFSVPQVFSKIHATVMMKVSSKALSATLFRAAISAAQEMAKLEAEHQSPSAWLNWKSHKLDELVLAKVRMIFGGRLRAAVVGGAALAPSAAEFMQNLGIPVYEGYGLSETSPIVACNSPGAKKLGTVGQPLPGVEIQIWGGGGVTLPMEMEGELVVSGPNVMQGYHNLPEATKEVIEYKNGKKWFKTGDLAVIEAGGFVKITGRAKEQYKLDNGKYVVPAPIEETLKLSRFIHQAFVYGDNKPYNVMLVVPGFEFVRAWAKDHSISLPENSTNEQLLSNKQICDHLVSEVEHQLTSVKNYERPKKWTFLPEEFTVENGLATPKLSMKRKAIFQRYYAEINKMYTDGETGPNIDRHKGHHH